MNPCVDYLDAIKELIEKVKKTEVAKMKQAAEILANAVVANKLIYLWGPGGHSSIFSEDVLYRKGELAALCPIYDPSISLSHGAAREINGMERVEGYGKLIVEYHNINRDDVVVLGSAYGINPVAIEGALECRKRGAYVISITSPAFSDRSTYANAMHKSKKTLYQVSDLYIDSYVPYGDAILKYDCLDRKISPVATIMQAIILKALLAETIVKIKEKGIQPPIWTNSLQEGGIEENAAYMAKIWGKVKSM
ncbi:MAG: sugar isomerase domain-containing protein [Clostridiaceae bacterium]|nr:sugar isomerase domain-containing protein [Clostridiaceae bacterium]